MGARRVCVLLGLLMLAVAVSSDVAQPEAEAETLVEGSHARSLLGDYCKEKDKCGRWRKKCCGKKERCYDGKKCVPKCYKKEECGYKCCDYDEKCYGYGHYKKCVDKYYCKKHHDCEDLRGHWKCDKKRYHCVEVECKKDKDCKYKYGDDDDYKGDDDKDDDYYDGEYKDGDYKKDKDGDDDEDKYDKDEDEGKDKYKKGYRKKYRKYKYKCVYHKCVKKYYWKYD